MSTSPHSKLLEASRTEDYKKAGAAVAEMEADLKLRFDDHTKCLVEMLDRPEYDLSGAVCAHEADETYYNALLPAVAASGKGATTRKRPLGDKAVKAGQRNFRRPANFAVAPPSNAADGDEQQEDEPVNQGQRETAFAPAKKKKAFSKSVQEKQNLAQDVNEESSSDDDDGAYKRNDKVPAANKAVVQSGQNFAKSILGPKIVSERSSSELPDGILSKKMLSVKQSAELHCDSRFFEGQTIRAHPWMVRAIKQLMPQLATYTRELGLAKICLASKFEAYIPPDAEIQVENQMKEKVQFKMDLLEGRLFNYLDQWRNYFVDRPDKVYKCMVFPQMLDYIQAVRHSDRKMAIDMTTFIPETVKGYLSLLATLKEVDDYTHKRSLLTKSHFFS